jgi:RNA polymerase sigma-B factor
MEPEAGAVQDLRMSPATTHSFDVDATVMAHQPLGRRLARRYARGDAELLEELEQVAALGLVKAARRFDPERGTAFQTFAIPTVLGELRRHFRSTRWAVHVPRRLQEAYLAVRETESQMTAETGCAPSAADLCGRLGWPVEELLEVHSATSALTPVSLDARGVGDDEEAAPLVERVGSEDSGYAAAELRDELQQAIALLDPPADEAVRLRFEEQLTVKEVAARIGVSPSHASKLVERSLSTLRAIMRPQAV